MARVYAAILLAGLCAACARMEPPGDNATAADVRAYCRASTSTERAAELDRPGATGPVAGVARSAQQAPASGAAYQNCLRRYGITP